MPENIFWPGYFVNGTSDVYLYVDSWNAGTRLGAVVGSDETNNRAERHCLVVTGPNPGVQATSAPG